ncbi:MAG: ATP-binding protein [Planctomycetes bacterium]|nr:ATP-binding protein [Planctomycetota bacterium]
MMDDWHRRNPYFRQSSIIHHQLSMVPKKLIWQLYPGFLVVPLVGMIAVTAYCSHYFRRAHYGQVRDELSRLAEFAADEVHLILAADGADRLDRLCKQLGRPGGDQIRLSIIDPTGRVLGDSHEDPASMENHAGRPEIREARQNGGGSSIRFSPTLETQMMYVAVAVKEQDTPVAVVRVASPLTEIDHVLRGMYLHMVWAGAIVAVAAALLSLWISRGISRPIVAIQQVAERFAGGQLDLRVPMPPSAELAALARSLNQMAAQLGERIATITEQRNKLDAVLSSMAEGVFAVDDRSRIVSVNPAASGLLGVDPVRAQGRLLEEVIRNVDLQQFVRQTLAGVQPAESDISLPLPDGRDLSLQGAALTDARGRPSGAVIVLNDMTRIRRLETVRRDFVANVSHELKTPVTSIQGFVEALTDGGVKDPTQVERYLDIISRQATRLNAIIDDLLALSRLEEAGERRTLTFGVGPIQPVLEEAIRLSGIKAQEKKMTVALTCAPDVEARINPPLLEQAVMNLIDNAVKYSPEGSRIRVEAAAGDREVTIAVADEGYGIAAEHLPRIFERFYVVDKSRSRKLGGTGLGLAIVKHIAQAHGGRVTVESTPGSGSTFALHLPA